MRWGIYQYYVIEFYERVWPQLSKPFLWPEELLREDISAQSHMGLPQLAQTPLSGQDGVMMKELMAILLLWDKWLSHTAPPYVPATICNLTALISIMCSEGFNKYTGAVSKNPINIQEILPSLNPYLKHDVLQLLKHSRDFLE